MDKSEVPESAKLYTDYIEDLSNGDTANVTISEYLDSDTKTLYIAPSEENYEIYVNSCYLMFNNITTLKEITFDNFKLSPTNLTSTINMNYMFNGCSALTTLNGISDWDTSYVKYMARMFSGCVGLTSLDLSSWDTSMVTSTKGMFKECSSLKTIKVSDDKSYFTNTTVNYSDDMFIGCSRLTGKKGSTIETVKALDSTNYLNVTYARIDNGSDSADTAGYFTTE